MKQHVTPLVIQGKQAIRLERVSLQEKTYDENWIQEICFENPTMLPVYEIEPSFGGLVSICRELNTESGPCDLVYINEQGFITIGECKLWRNPEARRTVVGQILDYAKAIATWDYKKFEAGCLKARKEEDLSLYGIVKEYFPDIIEDEFIDRVQRNLERGRFLLLILGDGIRENMEDLVDYIQGNVGLHFTLSLIETPLYQNPQSEELIITPRVLARTREIERTVIRSVEPGLDEGRSITEGVAPRSKTITEKDFYERLETSRGREVSHALEEFVDELTNESGLAFKLGRGKRLSLNIKSADDTYNLASVQEDGEVWFYGIVTKTEQLGNRQIGIDYLKELSQLVDGQFDDSYRQWNWCVRRSGQYIVVDEYLRRRSDWKNLMENLMERIQEVIEEE